MHIDRLREELRVKGKLLERLEALAEGLTLTNALSIEEMLQTIEVITMTEKFEAYYSDEQLEQLRQRREALGDSGMKQAQEDWSVLIQEVRRAIDDGVDPGSPPAGQLAERWRALVQGFTGGDPGLETSLRSMYAQEEGLAASFGIDPDITDFIQRASRSE